MTPDGRSARFRPLELRSALPDAVKVARRNGVGDAASVIAYHGG